MDQPDRSRPPRPVRLASIGIGLHVLGHAWVLATSLPLQLNVGNVFHGAYGIAYLALAVWILGGRNWTRLLITMLLVNQFIGRFEIFFGWDDPGVRAANIAGWLVSTAIIVLLWAPRSSRRFFTATEAARLTAG